MTTAPTQLVVLDMAGTTIDEGLQVYRVLAETAIAHGASPSEADIARWHGAAKHEALRALLTTRGGDVTTGRPAPYMIFHAMEALAVTDVARVLVAGDTPRDLQAGINSGAAYVVGVLSGASDADELGAHRHTHLLSSVAELPALLGVRSAAVSTS